jgi:hypothetical protein
MFPMILAAGCADLDLFAKKLSPMSSSPSSVTLPTGGGNPRKGSTGGISYGGGVVISNARVYTVFWGGGVDRTVQSQIPGFFQAVVDSTMMDFLSQYSTQFNGGTGQQIGRGSYAGTITINPSVSGGSIDDFQIEAELTRQISSGALPQPDSNTVYMTYFPPGITVTAGGGVSCHDFCAYHSVGSNFFYGAFPDTSACPGSCGLGLPSHFDAVTFVSSHELAEAITDPANVPAWYFPSNGSEIGDVCEQYYTEIRGAKTYVTADLWDMGTNACNQGAWTY